MMICGSVWRGFRFGTLLQIAVGPVCLFVFRTAATSGFLAAEAAVLAVTLADTLYVAAALLGVGTIIEKNRQAKSVFSYLGAAVITLFGISSILGAFGVNIIPGIGGMAETTSESAFINALLLTLSSPLTIVFWAGIFTAKITSGETDGEEVYYFAAGAILSTPVFMSFAAAAGVLTGSFLPGSLIAALNAAVEAVLVFFGIRTAFRGRFSSSFSPDPPTF